MPEESQIEGRKHQDNADIHDQPYPEPVSEEREIHADYDGDHRQYVQRRGYPALHFSKTSFHFFAFFGTLCLHNLTPD
jgi:hypothetical protein